MTPTRPSPRAQKTYWLLRASVITAIVLSPHGRALTRSISSRDTGPALFRHSCDSVSDGVSIRSEAGSMEQAAALTSARRDTRHGILFTKASAHLYSSDRAEPRRGRAALQLTGILKGAAREQPKAVDIVTA